jgi:hypothetical protein
MHKKTLGRLRAEGFPADSPEVCPRYGRIEFETWELTAV